MKVIYFLLSIVIVVGGVVWWIFNFNNNPLVAETSKNESGVEVVIKEFSKIYSQADLSKYLESYTADMWSVTLLTPPAYPHMYKLINKQSGGSEVAIWYSGKYLLVFKAANLFTDGSAQEDVLEKNLQMYPSSVNVQSEKSRFMNLWSSYF